MQADPIGLSGGINIYGYGENSPLMRQDNKGLFTIEKNCFDKDSTLEEQLKLGCQKVASKVKNPILSQCIQKKCETAHITCDGIFCWALYNPAWNNFFYDANLCLSKFQHIGGLEQWGCVLIHELAHACGSFFYQHPSGGEGVPASKNEYDPYKNEYDPYECKDFLR